MMACLCRGLSIFTRLSSNFELISRQLLTAPANLEVYDMSIVRKLLAKATGSSASFNQSRVIDNLSMKLADKQSDLTPRKMLDSYCLAKIGLSENLKLREKYNNHTGGVRFGRLLEDLDTMAVQIAYKHVHGGEQQQKTGMVIVTAAVDKILYQSSKVKANLDVIIRGHVTHVGSTSLEIEMHIEQGIPAAQPLIVAKFLMVARDPFNKGAAFVNPLKLETAEEEKIFETGKANRKLRWQQSQESLLKLPPSEAERLVIHELFLNSVRSSTTLKHPKKGKLDVWMSDAILKNIVICFPEKRNLYNKIFGGFLMRKAFELGWTSSYLFSGEPPQIVTVDDIMFRRPVEIGSLLFLSSQVVFTQDYRTQVKVHAEVCNDGKSRQTTNVFYFTFAHKENVYRVLPKTYAEYMMYLDGKRHFEANNHSVG